ncbi:MAG: hypothetical protein Kow0092_16310 [Deferrisomatales bacterium]
MARTRRRRLLFALLPLLAVGLLYGARQQVAGPVLARLAATGLRSALGVEVSIEGVQGTYLTDLEIVGLRTRVPNPDGPLPSLAWTRLRVEYSLPSLWRGIEAFLARTRIEVDGARVEVNLAAPSSGPAPESSGRVALPRALPAVRLRGGAVRVRLPEGSIDVQGLSASAERAPSGGTRLELRAEAFSWDHPRLRPGAAPLEADALYTGEAVTVTALALGGRPLVERVRVELDKLPESLSWDAALTALGGRLEVAGSWAQGALEARWAVSDLAPGMLLSLLQEPGPSLEGRLTGRGGLRLPPGGVEDLQGDAEAAFRDARVGGQPLGDLAVTAAVGNGHLRLERLSLDAENTHATLRDVAVPLAALTAPDPRALPAQVSGAFEATCRDLPGLLRAFGVEPVGPAAPPAHLVTAAGRVEAGEVRVERARLTAGEAVLRVEGARVELPGPGRPAADAAVEGAVHARLPDLGLLSRLAPLPPLAGALEADGAVQGTLGRPRGDFRVSARAASWKGFLLGDVRARLAYDGGVYRLEDLRWDRGRDRLRGGGAFLAASGELRDVSLTFAVADLAPYAQAFGLSGVPVAGRLEGALTAGGPPARPRVAADLKATGARVGAVALSAARLRVERSGDESRVEALFLQAPRGELRLSARLDHDLARPPRRIRLDTLQASWDRARMELREPALLTADGRGGYRTDGLALEGTAGTWHLRGRASPRGPWEVTLAVAGANGRGWLEAWVGDRASFEGLDGRIHLGGTPEAPELTLAARLQTVRLRGLPGPASGEVEAAYGKGALQVTTCRWRGPGGAELHLQGALPLALGPPVGLGAGPLSLTGAARISDGAAWAPVLPPEWGRVETAEASLALEGTGAAPTGRVDLSVGGWHPPGNRAPLPPGPFPLEAGRTARKGVLALDRLEVRSPSVTGRAAGRWEGPPPLGALLAGAAPSGGRLSLEGDVAVGELGWAARGVEGIRRLSGRLDAHVAVDGPADAPRWSASVRLAEGELRPQLAVPPLGKLELAARVDPDGVRLETLRGELGAAPFRAAGTAVRGTDGRWVLDLGLRGENLLLVRNEEIKVRADADLRATGPWEALRLSGEVAITDGRFSRHIDLLSAVAGPGRPKADTGLQLFSLPDPPLRDARFDVRITAKNPFVVRTNLARGALRPALRLTGTGEVPVLTGELYLDSARLALPAGRLTVSSGVVRFLPADPDRPRLDLTAGSRLLGYEIQVGVEGPVDEPVITLSSTPPLPHDELLLLLLTGQPPRSASGGAAQSQGMNVAVYLGRDLLNRWVGSDSLESDESLMDRFDIQIGREVTQSGDQTVDARFRLTEGALGRNDTWYLVGEKDVYDDLNAGLRLVFRFR